MLEQDIMYNKILEGFIEEIEEYCNSTIRVLQIKNEQQLRKDVTLLCGKLLPEITIMLKALSQRIMEIGEEKELLIQICDNYKELFGGNEINNTDEEITT